MGDYTAYVRSQVEERRKPSGAKFMKDGFDRWAESSAPARSGQMEKSPAEATNTMRNEMTDRQVGGMMCRHCRGGVLPLLAPAAIAAAPYVVPAAAGFAAGIYSGVKGQRKVDKLRQQIAREERAKVGGSSGITRGMEKAEIMRGMERAEEMTGMGIFTGKKWEVVPMETGSEFQLRKGSEYKDLTPWSDFSGFRTGWRTRAAAQKAADALNKSFISGMGAGETGAGFREGVRETQNVYGNLADAAVYGFDAYESAKKGVTGLPGALRSGAQVAESVLKVKDSAQKAASEFSKGGFAYGSSPKNFIPGYTTYVAAKTLKSHVKAARGKGKVSTAVNLGLAGYDVYKKGKKAKESFDQGDYIGTIRQGVDAGLSAHRGVKAATGKGKTDGRAARAAIVKKVMAERGVKMIEASKIVKAEGLY